MSTSGFQVSSGNTNFLLLTSNIHISTIQDFVSDSSPAKPKRSAVNPSKANKAPVTQRSLLLRSCSRKPQISESDVPPELIPQVLIEDILNEFVDPVESDKATGPEETGGASDWAHREVTSLVNAPVGGLLPSTSLTTTIPCSPRLDQIQTTTQNPPLPATIGKRVSPFTKFLTNSPVQGDKSATSPASKKRNTRALESPPITATSPGDVGETKLERILAEAAEEAGDKVLSRVTNREEHSGLSSPDGMESPQTTSKALKSKDSTQGTKSRGEPNDNSSGSDSSFDSESSSGLSSVEEMELPDPKTSKCKKQATTTMTTFKKAKPRHVLAGWMYHKYPILKFFATAPADAARYPYKHRCRVCLVELSLMTKGPIEILHHYRTDGHLIKEHRIRMETPGLPSFR